MKKASFKILKEQAADKVNRIVTIIENKHNEIKLRLEEDEDLKFLDELSIEDLEPLIAILKSEQNQRIDVVYQRINAITDKIINREDKLNTDDIKALVSFIKSEIHLLGGNTLVNLGRGNQGVTYKEIVKDVCKRIGINKSRLQNQEDIEVLENFFFEVFQEQFDKLRAKYATKDKDITSDEIEDKLFKQYTNGAIQTLIPTNLTGPAWRKTLRIVLIVRKLRRRKII
jgi:hypothetical protein